MSKTKEEEQEVSQEDCNRQSKFKDPKFGSLKDILEELYKLQDSDFKRTVFGHLKKELQPYCGDTYLDAFYGGRGGSSYGGYIQAFTFDARNICLAIVKSVQWDGRSINIHAKHDDCIKKYAEALKDCLPKTYAALYYLYFMGSKTDFSGMHGGQWKDYACNGNDYDYRGGSKVDLYLWLTDMNGQSSDFIRRGFTHSDKHSFTNKKGSDVATVIANIIKHDFPEALQKVLCGLMFVCTWDPSLLGHVCLFLYHFCEKVMEDQVGGDLQRKWEGEKYKVNFENLNAVCIELQKRLLPFTGSVSHESYIIAVYNGSNTNLFEEIWDENKFVKYCKWLEKHLPRIIESLASMSKDSENWKSSSLTNASSPGPFKYGFVFKDKSWEDGNINSNLQPLIKSLTGGDSGSLNSLLQCLNGDFSANSEAIAGNTAESSSGAAAAGASVGVISLGGAGAGVAYGFNLFGLKDIMSGVFGAIRGLVVGF